jgi:signal transduction histidine kinase
VGIVLHFTYLWLDDLVRDQSGTLPTRLVEEVTGGYGAFALSWFTYLAWRRAPLRGPHALHRIPGYLTLAIALSIANTSFMWWSRTLLFPAFGLGSYDYGRMPLRYVMEAPGSLIGFTLLIALLAVIDGIRDRRERERTQAEMERALVSSQLQSLRLQLQPHFLFNALNTISARLHEDPAAADALLGRLAELLRASLRSGEKQQVPLRDELELLRAYAEIMIARFGDPLRITISVPSELNGVLVPPLLLQPLVENAVAHGGLGKTGRSLVQVVGRNNDGLLILTVTDDGPGVAAGRDPMNAGIGLSTAARRLQLLHGDLAELTAANVANGGFRVHIKLPLVFA